MGALLLVRLSFLEGYPYGEVLFQESFSEEKNMIRPLEGMS